MAYSEKLATRIRDCVEGRPHVVERKMFGGLCFTVGGNMACGVVGNEIMVRVGPDQYDRCLAQKYAREMDFTGRALKGMVYVGADGLKTKPQLRKWVDRGAEFAASLPIKPAKKKPPKKKKAGKRDPSDIGPFDGFGPGTRKFLAGLERNNSKPWFDKHRADYDTHYLQPAQSFVAALGAKLTSISPELTAEPRVNGSIFRVNRDVRFSRDKTPYKPHIDLWFWEGNDRAGGSPGFFMRLRHDRLFLGTGIHGFPKPQLDRYRAAVAGAQHGPALVGLEKKLAKSGYALEGLHYKKVPREHAADHPRERLLRFNALHAGIELPMPAEAGSKKLVPLVMGHFRKLSPLHRWLLDALG